MSNEINPITTLILAERERQTAKWGNPHRKLDIWLLILQEEMGEVAKAFLELKVPDKWAGTVAWAAAYNDLITEAVQVTAVAVQMGERISQSVGWPASSEEVIRLALSGYQYSPGDPVKSFAAVSSEVGMIAAIVSEAVKGNDGSVSRYIRRIIFYGYELIYRLQQKGGVSA